MINTDRSTAKATTRTTTTGHRSSIRSINSSGIKQAQWALISAIYKQLSIQRVIERLVEMSARLEETDLSVLSKKMKNAIPFSEIAKLAAISIDVFFIDLDWNMKDLLSSLSTQEVTAFQTLISHFFDVLR